MFVNFPVSLLLLVCNFVPLWSEKTLSMLLVLNVVRSVFDLTRNLPWRMFSVCSVAGAVSVRSTWVCSVVFLLLF